MIALQACGEQEWIVDSGCTRHMTNWKPWIGNARPSRLPVTLADKSVIYASAEGELRVQLSHGCVEGSIYHLEMLAGNLMSVRALTEDGYWVIFAGNQCIIAWEGDVVAVAEALPHGLYKIGGTPVEDAVMMTASNTVKTLTLWHQRMAHLHQNKLKKLPKLTVGMPAKLEMKGNLPICEPCILGKQHRKPFFASDTIYENPFDMVV